MEDSEVDLRPLPQFERYADLATVNAPIVFPSGTARRLPFELEDGPVNQRFLRHHTGIINQIARGEIITAVNHDVKVFDDPLQRSLRPTEQIRQCQ